MATGTGKTYTGLGALVDLYNHCHSDLAVVICCPFIHLVEQWVEDLVKFNIEPIVGYGSSTQKIGRKNYKRLFNTIIIKLKGRNFSALLLQMPLFILNLYRMN